MTLGDDSDCYAYALDNPLTFTDPSGYDPILCQNGEINCVPVAAGSLSALDGVTVTCDLQCQLEAIEKEISQNELQSQLGYWRRNAGLAPSGPPPPAPGGAGSQPSSPSGQNQSPLQQPPESKQPQPTPTQQIPCLPGVQCLEHGNQSLQGKSSTGPFVTDFTSIEQAFADDLEAATQNITVEVLEKLGLGFLALQTGTPLNEPPAPSTPAEQTTELPYVPPGYAINDSGQVINPSTGQPVAVPEEPIAPDDFPFLP